MPSPLRRTDSRMLLAALLLPLLLSCNNRRASIAVIPRTLEFDAVATYDIDRYHFQFNVNNIADELNYTQSFGNRGTPSAGRTFIASVGIDL